MLESKYKIGEDRIRIMKVIMKSGKNINKAGECKVYIEIVTYNSSGKKTKRIPTSVSVLPKNWNSKKDFGSVLPKDPDHQEKNNIINGDFMKYGDQLVAREKGTWSESFKPDDLISIDDMFPKVTKGLIEFCDDYITFRKNQGTQYGTLKEFTTCRNRIEGFDEFKNNKTLLSDINISWSDSFESYLRNKKNDDGSFKYMDGTIEKTYTILVTILNHFHERKDEMNIQLTDKFRSSRFKRGSKSINEPNPLTKDQLLQLYLHTFKEPHLEQTKFRFCLQCFTGLRYGDAFRIKPENVIDGWLKLKPAKTKRYEIEVNQPLNEYAIEILKKHSFDTSSLYITNQVYNRQLKNLFPIMIKEYPDLNYGTDYGTHCGRDTFITLSVLAGTNWKSILSWVGQSSYKIMNRYIKILPKYQENEMKNIF
jgi:integrase